MIEFLLAITAGIFAGTITGLVPGIHINLVSIGVVGISAFLLSYSSPAVIGVFIVAMAVTHTFIDIIPSVYLGAPDEDTALGVLPGHELLLSGIGHEAVRLTVIGSLLCLLLCILLFPVFVLVFPIIYTQIKSFIGWILLALVIFMILKEKGLNNIFWSIAVFLFSGILGMIVLSMESLNQPLFPMLSGLFGVSMLIYSMFHNTALPEQRITEEIKIGKLDTIMAVSAGTLAGGLTALLPGVGAAHAAIIASTFFRGISSFTYLIIIGGVNTVNFLLSLVTVFTLSKARNGAVVALLEIMKGISMYHLLIFISAALVTGGIAAVLALNLSKVFCKFIPRIRYKMLCMAVIAGIVLLVFLFSGFAGLFILIVSTSIGLIPVITGVGRNNAMGCLLLPVILFFLL